MRNKMAYWATVRGKFSHWRTNRCRILLFTGSVLYVTARRQQTLRDVPAASRILPSSSPEPSVASAVRPPSCLPQYSTSMQTEERQTGTTGMGQKGSGTHCCSSFSLPHITISLSLFFSICLEGKKPELLTMEKGEADEIHFKQNK